MQWTIAILAAISLMTGFAMMIKRANEGRLYDGYLPMILVILSVILVIVAGAF